jgi:hypothetical protein
MGEMRNAGSILVREPERTSQFGRAGRKWIKKKRGYEDMEWIEVAQDSIE